MHARIVYSNSSTIFIIYKFYLLVSTCIIIDVTISYISLELRFSKTYDDLTKTANRLLWPYSFLHFIPFSVFCYKSVMQRERLLKN